jgi:hypothetical protein
VIIFLNHDTRWKCSLLRPISLFKFTQNYLLVPMKPGPLFLRGSRVYNFPPFVPKIIIYLFPFSS